MNIFVLREKHILQTVFTQQELFDNKSSIFTVSSYEFGDLSQNIVTKLIHRSCPTSVSTVRYTTTAIHCNK